jgi:hypothetical protein
MIMDTKEELIRTGLRLFRACLHNITKQVNSGAITSQEGNELSNELIDDYTDIILDCQKGSND